MPFERKKEMSLFHIVDGKVQTSVAKKESSLDEVREFVFNNLEALLGLELIAKDFQPVRGMGNPQYRQNFSLAFNPKERTFIILWFMHRASFEVLHTPPAGLETYKASSNNDARTPSPLQQQCVDYYNEIKGGQMTHADFVWDEGRLHRVVILLEADLARHERHELFHTPCTTFYKAQCYGNEAFLLEKITEPVYRRIPQELSRSIHFHIADKNYPKEVETLLQDASAEVYNLYHEFVDKIMWYDPEICVRKNVIDFSANGRIFLSVQIHPQKPYFDCWLYHPDANYRDPCYVLSTLNQRKKRAQIRVQVWDNIEYMTDLALRAHTLIIEETHNNA